MDQYHHKSVVISIGSVLSVDRSDNLFFKSFAFDRLENLIADELWIWHIAFILYLLPIKCDLAALEQLFFVDHNRNYIVVQPDQVLQHQENVAFAA